MESVLNRVRYGLGDGYYNYPTDTGVNSGVIQYLYYFLALTLIILLVLVLVHFTLTPIFITRPGGKGIVPLPGTDDSKVYWKRSESALVPLKDVETPLGTTFENYSMMLDIQIDNPTTNTDAPRVLFTRGTETKKGVTFTAQDTILTMNDQFNLILYLDRITNDLNVTIQTMGSGSTVVLENITVPNIPAGRTVRIGVMVGSRVLEVYVNGYLARSKAFSNSVRSVVGNIYPPEDKILSSTARVSNLRLWGRPLSPSEFRAYGSPESYDRKEMPDSCAS
jgi:hypothetical protein